MGQAINRLPIPDDPEVFEKTEEAAEPTISKVLPGFNAQL
jgi:hypothetical protein